MSRGEVVELVRERKGWREVGVVMAPCREVDRRGRGDVLVLKEPGRHYHSGQGRPWNYAPAQYRVYLVLDDQGERLTAERLVVFNVRSSP